MKVTTEIMSAGVIAIIVVSLVYGIVVNMDRVYDGGCAFQMKLHPNEYSKCVTCGKIRPNKHLSNVRSVGMVCDTHLGLED